MPEPDFNIETVDPGDIGFHHLNLQAELTDLDDIYDGALLFFEWGESDSLEEGETEVARAIMKDEDGNFKGSVTGEQFTADEGKWVDLDYYDIKMPVEVTDTDDDELYNEGTDYEFDYVIGRIKVLEGGDMEDGTDYEVDYDYGYGNVIIDGLSEDTEYHYKAIAESIAYDSEASMENIFENERNTEAILNASNQDAMRRSKMLSSPHIVDTMWSKEMASEKIWKTGKPEPPTIETVGDGTEVNIGFETTNIGGKALHLEAQNFSGETSSPTFSYTITKLDVTNVNTFGITTATDNDHDFDYKMKIIIGNEELSMGYPHDYTERTLDVSGIIEEHDVVLEIEVRENATWQYWKLKELYLE